MPDGGLYGIAALVIGGAFSMGVAYIGRPKNEPVEPDLSTLAGVAAAFVEQSHRIDVLEVEQQQDRARIGAFSRYMATLQDALRRAGLPVPDPAPEDAPLIRG